MTAEEVSGGAVRVHATLPIFRLGSGGQVVYYAPGRAFPVPAEQADQVEAALASKAGSRSAAADALAWEIQSCGRAANEAWRHLAERPFEPECLTLVLSNRCDLACRYCYAASGRGAEMPVLPEPAAERAAQLVARRCAAASRPMTVVFHGGGEPTFEWDLLVRLRAMAGRVAAEHGIPAWTHVATHGAIDESRAVWLATHVDHVGLSCDGPPDIQDAQRRAPAAATSALVERTARVLRNTGTPFTVRVTVTPASASRQEEIVDYATQQLGARRVHVEPVYRGRDAGGPHFQAEDAEGFVEHYIRASAIARARGCELETSGARPGDIHGPYCNPLRGVVQLGPDGTVSGCFLDTGSPGTRGAGSALGRSDPCSGGVTIDRGRAEALQRQAARVPERCANCINVYHCARGCPDVCVAEAAGRRAGADGFRCRIQRGIALWRVRQMAAGAIH